MSKIFIAMLLAAGLANYANATNNLLKSTAIEESGTRFYTYYPVVLATTKFENGKAIVEIPEYQQILVNAVQLFFDVQLDEGKTYKFKFKIDSSKDGSIEIHYLQNNSPFTDYAISPVAIKTGINEYEVEFTPQKVNNLYDSPRSLRFFLGKMVSSKIVISDILLEEVKK